MSRIHAIESPSGAPASGPQAGRSWVPTGWERVDRALAVRSRSAPSPLQEGAPGGGLARGRTHEWCGCDTPSDSRASSRAAGGRRVGAWTWSPPLVVLGHLARRGLESEDRDALVVWIGRRVWPYPRTLAGDHVLVAVGAEGHAPGGGVLERVELARGVVSPRADALLERSLLVDAPDRGLCVWAADLALRSSGVCVVVADASGFDMAASRRLQLAAAAGDALALLARPPGEARALSAASTRWLVRHARSRASSRCPSWTIEATRCRGGPWR